MKIFLPAFLNFQPIATRNVFLFTTLKTLRNMKLSRLKSISLGVLDYYSTCSSTTGYQNWNHACRAFRCWTMKGICSFETSGTYQPVTRRHIPGERSPQSHLCETLKTRHFRYHLEAFGYVSQPAIWWKGQLFSAPMTKWIGQISHSRDMAKGRDQFTAWAWEKIWPLL